MAVKWRETGKQTDIEIFSMQISDPGKPETAY